MLPKNLGRKLIVVLGLAVAAYAFGRGGLVMAMIPLLGLVVLAATVWRKSS